MGNVLLVGVGLTSATALQSLTAKCNVVGLLRKSDPSARPDAAITFALSKGIPVFEDTTLPGLRQAIDLLRPDCVVISSFDRIIPGDLLARCPFVNVHYAPLPQYRGRANVNWAIINGESHTAITVHLVDQGLDSGNILYQGLVTILPDDTVADLYDHLNRLQLQHLGDAVARFLAGDKGVEQIAESATYGCTRLPTDGEIDWSAPTQEIDALIRAVVKPFPGAFTFYNGRRLTIWRARPLIPPPTYAGRVPGRVVNVSKRDGFVDVLTGDGVLRLFEVELQGGTPVPPNQIIRTVKATLGIKTSDLLARIETLERELAALRAEMRMMEKPHAHV